VSCLSTGEHSPMVRRTALPTVLRRGIRGPLTWKRHRVLTPVDVVLASFPRSGGTWLAIMLAEYLADASFDLRTGDDAVPMVGEGKPVLSLPGGGWLMRTHESHRREYSRAILLVRDPRDVVVSYFHFQRDRLGLFDGSLDEFARGFVAGTIDHYGAWHTHVRSWLDAGADQVLVRYEDLRANPGEGLAAILRFLNVSPDPDRLRAVTEANSFEQMRGKEQRSTEATAADRPESARFVRSGSIGGWTGTLDPESVRNIELAMGATMRRVGYEPGKA